MSDQQQTKRSNRRRAPKRDREINAAAQQYMLEDHPFIVPLIVVLVSGLCAFSVLFTTIPRTLLVGANPSLERVQQYNSGSAWITAAALATLLLSGVFLAVNTVFHGVRVSRRKPITCPQCGAVEPRLGAFSRKRVKDTNWEEATCASCRHTWYSKVQ